MTSKVKVIDKGFKRILKEIKQINNSYVKVGILSKAGNYSFNRKSKGKKKGLNQRLSIASIGAVHEYGSQKMSIPSRPFMRQSFDRNKEVLHKASAGLLNSIYARKKTVRKALGEFGLFHQSQIQKEFTAGTLRAIKKETAERKGSSKPLIDTGRLKQSIGFEVNIK